MIGELLLLLRQRVDRCDDDDNNNNEGDEDDVTYDICLVCAVVDDMWVFLL